MRFILFIFAISFLLPACSEIREDEVTSADTPPSITLTNNEDKGINEVLSFYGGSCNYSIGEVLSPKTGTQKYVELEMSKSDVLDGLADKLEMPASNIAYLFYTNLESENTNYDEIYSKIVLSDGREKTYKYSREQLELVSNRMALAEKTVDLLAKRDYVGIRELLNGKPSQINEDVLIAGLKEIDPNFGDINEFIPYGFRIDVTNTGQSILHISGALIRSIQNSEFSIDVDLNSDMDEVFLIDYKL